MLHSRPGYYGALTAFWCVIPAMLIFAVWMMAEPKVITDMVISPLPDSLATLSEDRLNLIMNDIKNLVQGNIVSGRIIA